MAANPRSAGMRRLVYVSRSLFGEDVATVDLMVRDASARNAAFGVTGMLWFDGANFAQVLEGDHDHVGEIMRRIENDARHADLEIVVDREVKARAFGNWGMMQPDDSPESTAGTAFLIGLSLTQSDAPARRLHKIILACEL